MPRMVRITLAMFALLLGVVGLVLPFLQGWFFLTLGGLMLAHDVPFIARLLQKIEKRFPRLGRTIRAVSNRLSGENSQG